MKTRKISEYPVLTILEMDLVFTNKKENRTERYVKLGPNSWGLVRDDQMSHYVSNDYEIAMRVENWAERKYRVYKPCNHGSKIRVGGTA